MKKLTPIEKKILNRYRSISGISNKKVKEVRSMIENAKDDEVRNAQVDGMKDACQKILEKR